MKTSTDGREPAVLAEIDRGRRRMFREIAFDAYAGRGYANVASSGWVAPSNSDGKRRAWSAEIAG